jgi:hypothetical protein|tara:strand:- start:54 stop:383 length:330 start_codon:yes stop_codon:yes gene_type:complete
MILSQVNKRFDATGSSKMGTLEIDFDQIIKSFGYPTIVDRCDKTQVEWNITFELEDGRKVQSTIYDYTIEGPAELNKVWQIGGYDPAAAACINAVVALDKIGLGWKNAS